MVHLQFLDSTLNIEQAYQGGYNVPLVLLSFAVAVLATFSALKLSQVISDTEQSHIRWAWIGAGSVAMGIGIWAMHFIGMLAYTLPIPVLYDPWLTLLSVLPAIVASAVILSIISRSSLGKLRLVMGGALMGAGISMMHYTGMAAMRTDASMLYDPTLFFMSLIVAVILAMLALYIKFLPQRNRILSRIAPNIGTSMIMGLAVTGMHYTAMSAVYFFNANEGITVTGINPLWLAGFISGGSFLVLSLLLVATFAGKQTAIKNLLSLEIDRRIQAEREIKKNEEMYRALADNNQDTIIRIDKKHQHTYVNNAAVKQTGLFKESFIGKTIDEMGNFPAHLRNKWRVGINFVFSTGEPFFDTFEAQDQDGNIRTIDWRVFPELNRDGSIESVICVSRDISDRLRAEAEIQKLGKLSSLGTLAGGIAHDFNNILTVLFGYISQAKSELSSEHAAFPSLEKAENTFHRATNLTNQLLTFAKGDEPVKELINLGKLVEEVSRFDLANSKVELVLNAGTDLWAAKVDKVQMEQVVANLVINARQAMPEGGHLYITLENADSDIKKPAGLNGGKYIKVKIQDEGDGIDIEHRSHIFDPYFSTKKTGTGLGLATVHSIISRHGGVISVDSEAGHGTVFTMFVPAS